MTRPLLVGHRPAQREAVPGRVVVGGFAPRPFEVQGELGRPAGHGVGAGPDVTPADGKVTAVWVTANSLALNAGDGHRHVGRRLPYQRHRVAGPDRVPLAHGQRRPVHHDARSSGSRCGHSAGATGAMISACGSSGIRVECDRRQESREIMPRGLDGVLRVDELARHRTFQPLPASEKLTGPFGCTAPGSARAARRSVAGPGRGEDVYLKTGSILTA